MNTDEIKDWIKALSKNERLILATFEGGKSMHEGIEKYWNLKALESLLAQELIVWTFDGYDLTDDGFPLAKFLFEQDQAEEAAMKAISEKGEKLAEFIKSLKDFEIVKKIDGDYHHMGATICDAVLQAGVNYKNTVEPRIDRLVKNYPEAKTSSTFATLIKKEGISKVLDWKDGTRKPNTIKEMIRLFLEEKIEREKQLAEWLKNDKNVQKLQAIKGIGDKTVDYLKILVGFENMAVDRHMKAFLKKAGIHFNSYQEVKEILQSCAVHLNEKPQLLDHSIWKYMSNRSRNQRITPGNTGAGCAV